MKYNPYYLAEICEVSYKGKLSHDEWVGKTQRFFLEREGFTRLEFFYDKGMETQGFAVDYNGVTIICFPGTQDNKDILTNVFTKMNDDKDNGIHMGFWLSFCSVQKQIIEYLRRNKVSKVITTGHSLNQIQNAKA